MPYIGTAFHILTTKLGRSKVPDEIDYLETRQMQNQKQLVALDWGTSSLRVYRLGADAQVLESRQLPWGVMCLPEVMHIGLPHEGSKAGFDLAFEQVCGDWLQRAPHTPVIASGTKRATTCWTM